jgi:hypothetical protein
MKEEGGGKWAGESRDELKALALHFLTTEPNSPVWNLLRVLVCVVKLREDPNPK